MVDIDISDHRTLATEQVFDGKVVEVFVDEVRLPDGREARWERVIHPGAVGMVPLLSDQTIVLVRQYRHATGKVLLEIPAGKLEEGEPPEVCARRELAEEVGYRAGEMVKLAEFYNSPGYSDEYFHLFLARELEEGQAEAEPDEFFQVKAVHLEEAFDMISTGEVRDAKTVIGITLTKLLLAGEGSTYGADVAG
ncbi:MAG: NUDIX hydrolase [Actinobacteria bacterium]|nr:NUDIX hydrolase [Actinomycetota bacterium]